MRFRLIAGSLLGAVAVQVALVACGVAMRPDAGDATDASVLADVQEHADEGVLDALADAARDVAADVLDASGDALAQDGGGCGCPAADTYTQSFRGTFSLGGAATIRSDYSTSIVNVVPSLANGAAALDISLSATFYTTAANRVEVVCSLKTTTAGVPISPQTESRCLFLVKDGNGAIVTQASSMNAPLSVVSATSTAVEVRVNNLTSGTAATSLNLRVTRASGGLLTPPSNYTP